MLHGSPRKGMNSDTLVQRFIDGLNGEEINEIHHFYTNDLKIRPCQGCLKCLNPPDYSCVTKDDMQKIYTAFPSADIVVFATPMYWGYITAQLKAAIDRMEPLIKHFEGKTFVVLITYRHHYESTAAFFKRIADSFEVKLHIIPCCTYDENLGVDIPISSCRDKLEMAHQLGKKLWEQNTT
ncbi:flavodoxin family protein [Chloroflexota bacterium]